MKTPSFKDLQNVPPTQAKPRDVVSPKMEKRASQEAVQVQERRKRKLEQVERIVPSKVGIFKRAYAGKSMRAAINAHCLECQGFQSSEVRRCPIFDCPLWELRPYQEVKK